MFHSALASDSLEIMEKPIVLSKGKKEKKEKNNQFFFA